MSDGEQKIKKRDIDVWNARPSQNSECLLTIWVASCLFGLYENNPTITGVAQIFYPLSSMPVQGLIYTKNEEYCQDFFDFFASTRIGKWPAPNHCTMLRVRLVELRPDIIASGTGGPIPPRTVRPDLIVVPPPVLDQNLDLKGAWWKVPRWEAGPLIPRWTIQYTQSPTDSQAQCTRS